jgi:hypothetical protein
MLGKGRPRERRGKCGRRTAVDSSTGGNLRACAEQRLVGAYRGTREPAFTASCCSFLVMLLLLPLLFERVIECAAAGQRRSAMWSNVWSTGCLLPRVTNLSIYHSTDNRGTDNRLSNRCRRNIQLFCLLSLVRKG